MQRIDFVLSKSPAVLFWVFFMVKHRMCACARLAWPACAWESARVWHGYVLSDLIFYSNCSQARQEHRQLACRHMFTPQFIAVNVSDMIRQDKDKTEHLKTNLLSAPRKLSSG